MTKKSKPNYVLIYWKDNKAKFKGIVKKGQESIPKEKDVYVYPVPAAKELLDRYNKVELNKLVLALSKE